MYNPFQSILEGAKGLANKGKTFFQNVDAGLESVGSSLKKFQNTSKAVGGALKNAGLEAYDNSLLGKAADKTARFQNNFNKTVDTLIYDKDARKNLGSVARDEAAKATLSSSASGLTGLSRISANLEKGRDFANNKLGAAKYFLPQIGMFNAASDLKERFTGKSLLDSAQEITAKGADSLYKNAEFIDQYDQEAVTLEQVKADPSLVPQFYVQSVSQAAPSIAISAVATIVSGGAGAFTAGGLMEGGAQYTDAKANGASDGIADLAGLTNGIASGFLESLGARGIFKNNPLSKKISSNLAGSVIKDLTQQAGKLGVVSFLKAAAGEGGTEAAQQIVSNSIAKVLYDNERKIMEGALESGVVGALAGGSSNVAGSVVSGSIDISQKANKAYKEASPKEKQGGYIKAPVSAKNAQTESDVSKTETTEKTYKPVAEKKDFDSAEEYIDAIDNQGSDRTVWNTAETTPTETGKPVIIKGFHGTNKEFDTFELQDSGVRYSGDGIYFFAGREPALNFGDNVKENYLELKKPFVWYLPEDNIDAQFGSERARDLVEQGYDSLIVRTRDSDLETREVMYDGINEIVVFDTNAIKTKDQIVEDFNNSNSTENTIKSKPYTFTEEDSELIQADISNFINEEFEYEDINIIGIEHIGSTKYGLQNDSSDIDFVVEYSGDVREDDLYNSFNDYLEDQGIDLDGRKVDINFIKADKSGTLAEFVAEDRRLNLAKINGEKFQATQSPQFQELSRTINSLQKQWDNASSPAVRNRIEKALNAAQKKRAKYQDTLKHTLQKNGYITTDEAIAQALKIPVFKTLSEKGQTVLRDKMNNPEALGSYLAGVISYVKNPHETTLPHETFHAVMDMGLNEFERREALDLAREESGLSEMTDLEAEEWLAQNFGNWYAKRTKRTFSDKLVAIFKKIKRFLTRLEIDTPKLEKLFRKVIDEDTARVVAEFKDVGGITAARKEFNQNPEVFTTQLFQDEALWKKGVQKRATVEAALNRIRKPIMREYAQAKLETEFNDQDSIDMGEFRRAILSDLLQVKIIESNTYSDYGMKRIGRTGNDFNYDTPKTYIINTNFNHKIKGHFNNDFDVTTTKDDLMIREVEGEFYVIRKDFSEATMESGVFQTFNDEASAQEYINDFANRSREEAGMMAHYRAFSEGKDAENRKDHFNVIEMQSDTFQNNLMPLVRDAKTLLKADRDYQYFSDIVSKLKDQIAAVEAEDFGRLTAAGTSVLRTDTVRSSAYSREFLSKIDNENSYNIRMQLDAKQEGYKEIAAEYLEILRSELEFNENQVADVAKKYSSDEFYFKQKGVKQLREKVEGLARIVEDKAYAERSMKTIEFNDTVGRNENVRTFAIAVKRAFRNTDETYTYTQANGGLLDKKLSEMTPEGIEGLIFGFGSQEIQDINNAEFEKVKERTMARFDELESEMKIAQKELEDYSSGYELSKSDSKELSLSKQFLSLRNNYPEQIVKHAIRQAAANGNQKIRFATPATVAYVQRYVETSETGFDEQRTSYQEGDLQVGDAAQDHLGIDGIVVEAESSYGFSIMVASDESPVEAFTREEFMERIDTDGGYFWENLDIEEGADTGEISLEDIAFAYINDRDDFRVIEINGEERVVASIDDDGNFSSLEEKDESYSQDVDVSEFKLEDIQKEEHRNIAAKYGIDDDGKEGVFYKILKKKRADLEMVTDENGYTWWESEIQPDDRAAVELFQKKNQIQKDTDVLNELETGKYYETVAFELKKETLENNPARSLMKFANKRTMELPEVLGREHNIKGSYAKSKFGIEGDEISANLGFETAEDARAAFEEYVESNEDFKVYKKEFQENKKRSLKQIRTLKEKVKRMKQGYRIGGIETKRDIKKNQKQLEAIITESDLSLHDRGKFLKTIKNVQSKRDLEKMIPKVTERIEKLEERAVVNTLKRRIIKLLKKTKPKMANGKPVGKYTPEIQDVFKKLYKAAKYTKEGAQQRIAEVITASEKKDGVLTADNSLELQMLSMMAGFDNKSPVDLYNLMRKIESMMNEGKMIRELSAFNKKTEIERKVNAIKDSIGNIDLTSKTKYAQQKDRNSFKERVKRTLKTLGSTVALDWDGIMETLDWNARVGNKKLRKIFSVNEQENKVKQLTRDWHNDFSFALSSAYGIKNSDIKIARKVRDLSRDEVDLGTFKNGFGKDFDLLLTRDQAIKKYMEFKDPDILETYMTATETEKGQLGNGYTQEMVDAIKGSLTDADIELADAMFAMYNERYTAINEVYSRLYGVNLPKNEFYSPIKREGFKVDSESGFGEFLENANVSTVNGGFLKSRVKNHNPIVDQGAIATLENHMNETGYFVAWADKARELKQVFSDNSVSSAIEAEFGAKFKKRINATIDDFITRGKAGKSSIRTLDVIRQNLTTSTLMLKPAIFIKQLTSNPAVLSEISVADYVAGTLDYFKNWKRNTEILNKESIVLEERGSNLERDIRDAANSEEFSRFSKRATLVNTLMLNVKAGDKGAIMPAVWALRRAKLKQGLSLKETIAEYEQFTSSTQQSSDISKMAAIQRGGSIAKFFTMYMTSPRQYNQKILLAVKSLFQEGGTKPDNLKKVARIIFIHQIMLPFVFQFVANAGRTDEEAWKDYKRAMILGSVNGIIIVKDMADALVRSLLGQMVFDPNVSIFGIIKDLTNTLQGVDLNDMSLQDFVDIIDSLEKPVEAATGFGIKTVKNIAGGVSDVAKGDAKGGIGNILGWTDYAMTGKNKAKRFTPEETKMLSTYKKMKALKDDGKTDQAKAIYDKLDSEQKAALKLVSGKIKKEEAQKLVESKEIKEAVEKLRELKSDDPQEAKDYYSAFTTEEKAAIKTFAKNEKKKQEKREEEESPLVLGIRGLLVDPRQTIKAALSDEDIAKVEGGSVVFKRMGFNNQDDDGKQNLKVGDSAEIKTEMMIDAGLDPKSDRSSYKLEHIVPLTAGGTNSRENLEIVTTADHNSFTPVDVALGKAVQSNTMNRRDAAQIARALKSSEITVEKAMELIANFGK